jgi:hypothetical protein
VITEMSRYEKVLQVAKIVLLAAILLIAVGKSIPTSHAQNYGTGLAYVNITTATNTQVATTPVTLHTITVNGGTTGVVTVYDNTSCATTGFATILAATAPVTLTYDAQMKTGICVTTAAATNVTVTLR